MSEIADEGLPAGLLAKHGWDPGDLVCRLGSANRHSVWLLERGGRKAVLKIHGPLVHGRRDGYLHEVLMHSFYAEHVADQVPALIAHDDSCRSILFEHVQGGVMSAGVPARNEIIEMAGFLVRTNERGVQEEARRTGLPWASESGLSFADHWQCAGSRIGSLLALAPSDESTVAMQAFLRAKVLPALAAGEAAVAVERSDECLSPSDFGFHNVFRRCGYPLCFFDFEHAGWDDPAKLAADFILQPEALLSEVAAGWFLGALEGSGVFSSGLTARVRRLLPVQRCKWVTIILNVFLRPGTSAGEKALRLAKAESYWGRQEPCL